MYIIFIRSYKLKSAILLLVFLAFAAAIFTAGFIMNNSLLFNITINDYLTFSHPYVFEIDNIYINEHLTDSSIQTNLSFKKPLAQQLLNYNSLKGRFSFSYPSLFVLSQKDFEGSDILYHIDFQNKSQQNSHGFVQVWNMPYSLEDFLNNSKGTSSQSYKYFISKPVTVNGMLGFYWDYASQGNDGKYYKGSEVFLKKADRMYRISYFVPEAQWNDSQEKIFWSIVNSFKTY